jgi:uncharacterized protein (TIGR02996 family)
MTPLENLTESLKAWRKTRHPRFALVAEFATKRALPEPRPLVGAGAKKADTEAWLELLDEGDVLDVPRLVEAVGGARSQVAAERLLLLAKLDDPRVVTGVLTWLEAPPYRARTALPFFRACAKVLAEANDPRVRDALLDLATRYKSIVDSSVGDDIALLLRRTAESIDQVKPGPLSPALEKKAVELEALFETERAQLKRTAKAEQTSQQSDDALLAAVYASPDDDGPRLVFADALTERGEVRGEFIALQIQRARGTSTPAGLRRERELIGPTKHKAEWGFPLTQGGDCRFSRGFPVHLELQPKTAKALIGNPALRTVQTLGGLNRGLAQKTGKALLEHETARHLQHVGILPRELLEKLEGDLLWPGVSLGFIPMQHELARFPRTTKLEVHQPWGTPLDSEAFQGQTKLTSLEVINAAPDLFAHVPNLTRLRLARQFSPEELKAALAPLTKLTSLELWGMPPPGALPTTLTELTCQNDTRVRVEPLVASLPRLRVLNLGNANVAAKDLAALLSQREALAQLQRLVLGTYSFEAPFTPQGQLLVRGLYEFKNELLRILSALAELPPDVVQRVVLRPVHRDPNSWLGPEPAAAIVEKVRASTKLPVSLEWY